MRAAVRASLADLDPGARVLVALSGGPDSLALLAATVRVCAEQGLLCGAVIVDHGLQAGSAEVAARAAAQARILGCEDVHVIPVEVARGPGAGGLEAAARTARYAALLRSAGVAAAAPGAPAPPDELAPSAAAILLGHTRDDQAESVLLGLARGSGTRSLAGMAPRDGLFRRPLLGLQRSVVAAAAAEEAGSDARLTPWSDPHNEDRAFARVRVRRDVLPVLADALGPGIADALARTAELARADADALDAWADRVWCGLSGLVLARPSPAVASPPEPAGLPIEPLLPTAAEPLPRAVVSRVVRRWLIEGGCAAGSLTAEHVRAVMALIGEPGSRAAVALPGGRRARREGPALVVRA